MFFSTFIDLFLLKSRIIGSSKNDFKNLISDSINYLVMEKELTENLKKNGSKYVKIENEASLLKIYNLFCHNIFIEPDFSDSLELFYYGYYYKNLEKNYDLMKKYYFMAVELGSAGSMNNLAFYYNTVEKNYDLTKKYYSMAIELGNSASMRNLGCYYETVEKNYDLMKKYYIMAIELGFSNAMHNLGHYYKNVEKNYDLMKKYFFMAIELGNSDSMHNLAYYYQNVEKNYDLMKKYYVMAMELGNLNSMYNLRVYYDNNESDFSFLKYADNFGDLIQKRFRKNVDLPQEYHHDFCQLKNVSRELKVKQDILKKTSLFPKNYTKEYDVEFIELVSMASCSNKYSLTKDMLLLIAGHLHT